MPWMGEGGVVALGPFALGYSYSTIGHQTKFELRRLIERVLYSMLCAAVHTPCCLADPLESNLGPWVLGTVQHERDVLDPRSIGARWCVEYFYDHNDVRMGSTRECERARSAVASVSYPVSAGRLPTPFIHHGAVSHCTPAWLLYSTV